MTTYRFDPAKVAKLAKGDVAVEHTMKEEDLPMLTALLKEASPKDFPQPPSFSSKFYLKWISKFKWIGSNIRPDTTLPLHSFLMEEEIDGWELVRKERYIRRSISEILDWDTTFILPIIFKERKHIERLREAGVLELWFKPIYKKREEPKEQPINFPAMTTQEAADWIKKFMDCAKLQELEDPHKYVPLQKCPICEGTGSMNDPLGQYTSVHCDVCNGSKLIPMRKVKEV